MKKIVLSSTLFQNNNSNGGDGCKKGNNHITEKLQKLQKMNELFEKYANYLDIIRRVFYFIFF